MGRSVLPVGTWEGGPGKRRQPVAVLLNQLPPGDSGEMVPNSHLRVIHPRAKGEGGCSHTSLLTSRGGVVPEGFWFCSCGGGALSTGANTRTCRSGWLEQNKGLKGCAPWCHCVSTNPASLTAALRGESCGSYFTEEQPKAREAEPHARGARQSGAKARLSAEATLLPPACHSPCKEPCASHTFLNRAA